MGALNASQMPQHAARDRRRYRLAAREAYRVEMTAYRDPPKSVESKTIDIKQVRSFALPGGTGTGWYMLVRVRLTSGKANVRCAGDEVDHCCGRQ